MADKKSRAVFGAPGRFYSSEKPTSLKESAEEEGLRRLLEKFHPELERKVERVCKKWNNIVRESIRAETGLRLSIGDERASVPIKVVSGIPNPLLDALSGIKDNLIWELLLRKSDLDKTNRGLAFLASRGEAVERLLNEWKIEVQTRELKRVAQMVTEILKELDRIELLKKIAAINSDVLGAYFFRVPEIRIYWVAMGIIGSLYAIDIEALTFVALTHELSHAYTHLGRDIDEERWQTNNFAFADLEIVEGLAQFYTMTVCKRLMLRYPEAYQAFLELLKRQSGSYVAHKMWAHEDESAGEMVRSAMIECRSQGVRDYITFKSLLTRAKQQVGKRRRSLIGGT